MILFAIFKKGEYMSRLLPSLPTAYFRCQNEGHPILKCYLDFDDEFDNRNHFLARDMYRLPVKSIPEIYIYWCEKCYCHFQFGTPDHPDIKTTLQDDIATGRYVG